MELRHIFLIVALLATTVFVVPTVYSLFAGQHNFYDTIGQNIYAGGVNVIPCEKCHADIKEELDSSTYHVTFTCANCHILNTSYPTHGIEVMDLRCLDCHSTPPRMITDSNNNVFLSTVAKVFGENITNKESHNSFIAGANASPLMKGENEACTSCHTAKSLTMKMLYTDTYGFNANRLIDSTWQLSDYSKKTELSGPVLIQSNGSAGKHMFVSVTQLSCEKCHPDVRDQLNNSFHHTYFSCASCHRLYSVYHASSTPPCLDCHGTAPETVTDQKGNTFKAPVATVYADNQSGADAHLPFVLSANDSNLPGGSNVACTSCHSSFNDNISFIRPSFIEWDVVNSGTWTIQNLAIGATKEIRVTKHSDGKMHNTSETSDIDCVSCHMDIEQAVLSGGHSNEQWKLKHNYNNYTDMNSYCESCHKPLTQDSSGVSPYPAYPFNSVIHGAMKISCMDCHGKSGNLLVNINGAMRTPDYSSNSMGSIEASIAQQPDFTQSYLCIACKNTGNPVPNNSLHFKLYTEPQVVIYINGVQRYP